MRQQVGVFPSGLGSSTMRASITMMMIALVGLILLSHQVEALGRKPTLDPILYKVLGNNCTLATLERDCGGLQTLVCLDGKCSMCNETTDCAQIDMVYSCKFMGQYYNETNGTSLGGICTHKDLLDYFSLFDLFSVLTNFLGSVLSSAGGTGGGGVFVPLLHVIGRFSAQEAVPLSKVMIFGAAITNFVTLFFKKHPFANRPLIDYDIALMMEPATLLGTIIGVFLNIICPEWVIVIAVILVLGITTALTFKKFIQRARIDFKRKPKEEKQSLVAEDANSQYGSVNKQEGDAQEEVKEDVMPAVEEEKEEVVSRWRVFLKTPWWKIVVLIICWLIIFTLSLLRGGHGAPSVIPGLEKCSPVYWVLVGLSFPIIGFLMIIVAVYLLVDYRRKVKNGFKFVEGDVKWNLINVTLYPGACFIAGILASLLGIGGGMIKSPLLLLLGSDPSVGAATASFMILFTSSISAAQFAIVGRIPLDYGLLYGLVGFTSGFVGFFFVTFGIERWGKKSLIILCVGTVLAFATLLMGGVGIYDAVIDFQEGIYMGFHNPCL